MQTKLHRNNFFIISNHCLMMKMNLVMMMLKTSCVPIVINLHNVENLDKPIDIEEVKKAISSLKRGKSCGIDDLKAEMFIDSKDLVSPMLCKLFNHLYANCLYPDSWTKGIIVLADFIDPAGRS